MDIGQRILYGISGAIFGALVALTSVFFMDEGFLLIMACAAAGGAVIAFFLGERAIDWLKEFL